MNVRARSFIVGRKVPATLARSASGRYYVWADNERHAHRTAMGPRGILTAHALMGPLTSREAAHIFPQHAAAIGRREGW